MLIAVFFYALQELFLFSFVVVELLFLDFHKLFGGFCDKDLIVELAFRPCDFLFGFNKFVFELGNLFFDVNEFAERNVKFKTR